MKYPYNKLIPIILIGFFSIIFVTSLVILSDIRKAVGKLDRDFQNFQEKVKDTSDGDEIVTATDTLTKQKDEAVSEINISFNFGVGLNIFSIVGGISTVFWYLDKRKKKASKNQ